MFRIISCSLIALLVGCGPKPIENKSIYNISSLPGYRACSETPEVYDPDNAFRRLGNYRGLSYAYTYNSINVRGDSLEREKIRAINAKLAQVVVSSSFPDIEIVDGSPLSKKEYSDLFIPESRIYSELPYLTGQFKGRTDLKTGKFINKTSSSGAIKKAEASIEDLTVPSNSNLQLFLTIRSYLYDRTFNNIVKVYIFNKRNKRLDYYDRLDYQCDIRDRDALVKVLNYALEKINSNTRIEKVNDPG